MIEVLINLHYFEFSKYLYVAIFIVIKTLTFFLIIFIFAKYRLTKTLKDLKNAFLKKLI